MSAAQATASRLSLVLALVVSSWVGLAAPVQAAAVAEVVVNNASGSAALNTDPSSWGEVDDIGVVPGGVLYLPASATVESLTGWVRLDDGTAEAFGPDDYTLRATSAVGDWSLTLDRPDVPAPITVRESAEVPAMFIRTGSGLAAIEADKDFEDTGASMALVDDEAAAVYADSLSEMKGRGNTTWKYPKKPYQIKLDTTTELVPEAGAHKTWILLANYLDGSLLRNQVAYNLEGTALRRAGAVDHAIKGRMLDLFIDGGFRGSYFLTEKVQVGATRLAIEDLQKANEAANPDLGSYAPVTVTSLTGAPGLREARYVPFPSTPPGYQSSGYLLEMDFLARAREERAYVVTRHGTPWVLKGPEDANAPEVAFVGNRLQRIEDAIFSPTGRGSDGVHYSELLDLPSWASYYVIQELLANDDAYKSSTFVHMDDGGRLRAGPLWDGDRTLGSLISTPPAGRVHVADPARLKPRWINQLLTHETFRTAVRTAYAGVVGPEMDALLAPDGHLARYAAEVDRSAALNKLRWEANGAVITYPTPAQDVEYLRSFVTRRDTALGTVWGGNFVAGALPPDGYYTIGNGALNLDVNKASLVKGANLQVWSPNRGGAQTFRLQRGADGLYSLRNVNSTLAMDVAGGVAANRTNVWQHTVNNTAAQKWRVVTYDGRNYTFASSLGITAVLDTTGPEVGYVLDVHAAGTVSGTNVQIYRSNGNANQRFTLNPVTLPAPPADGRTYTVASAKNTGKRLDVFGASPDLRANVQIWRANTSAAQRFTVNTLGNGAVELFTGTAAGRVVEVAGGGTTSGTNVWQNRANGTVAQQWTVRPTGDLNGSVYVVARGSGLHLDVQGGSTADGTNVWVYRPNGTAAQKFFFSRVP
ncbi:RICIN domain-containing protein [Ornithinimicrobium cerasi]|uniref:Ricin-type beta-trefoil lectin domain-like n=1 Tax=Ornithinimicrobium cerasi TaxID=2248773 RepID=A0A285VJP4_9MICO|nr:RICIN domain-containing protein [Ornithinimicrobium cerasi]SOC54203.1 Ricin-type beta-trefoil lectin domain-like [Ornithinimicrobium cerasi]